MHEDVVGVTEGRPDGDAGAVRGWRCVMKWITGSSRWVSGVVGAGAMVAALGTGVSSAWASDAQVSWPAAGSGSAVAVAGEAGLHPVTARELARLERLAREVAAPSGGAVTVTYRSVEEGGVSLLVETARRGSFSLSAWLSDDADGVQTARANCRSAQEHPQDGRICTTLRSTSTLGVWSHEYVDQPGRQSLELVATARGGRSLWVEFNNYTETPEGSKEVGPSWRGAGITVSGLREAAVGSGLTVIRT
jgi:hypothetical protein